VQNEENNLHEIGLSLKLKNKSFPGIETVACIQILTKTKTRWFSIFAFQLYLFVLALLRELKGQKKV
jgi:hypothetical protein